MPDEPRIVTREELNQEKARAAARARQTTDKGRELPADETVPGGKYVVNGVDVDANGEPLGKGK